MVDMVVGIRAGIRKGHKKFQFQQVMVRDIQPCTGPQSRGTRLYISGSNLDIDNNLTPYLDILPCTVDKGCRNMMVTGRNQPRMAVFHKNRILKETVLMELEGDLHCPKIHLSHKLLNMAGTFKG
nr:uncharacterized protein LOC119170365 [Rhipicephalus microplus]